MGTFRKIGIFGILLILVNTFCFFIFHDSIVPFLLNMPIAIYLCSFLFKRRNEGYPHISAKKPRYGGKWKKLTKADC